MKKILISIFLLCLMAIGASALVQYTGAPQLPYLIFGKVTWNDQLLAGTKLQITNTNTGFTETLVTDNNGYWQGEAGNWFTNDVNRPPLMYGDTIKIKALDGCGTADTCEKSFTAMTGTQGAYKDWAVIDFSLTGVLVCPPVSCPSCGGGGGGGCYIPPQNCTQKDCEKIVCPIPIVCPPEKVCDVCPIENQSTIEECPTCPESSPLGMVIAAIIAFVAGGGVIYVTFGKSNKVKVIKKDGKDIVYHQHPTISGYHSPDTIHKTEPHKKGELLPKYEKNSSGVWQYVT